MMGFTEMTVVMVVAKDQNPKSTFPARSVHTGREQKKVWP